MKNARLLTLLLVSMSAYAAPTSGPTTFGVSPPSIDLEGTPGDQISSTIKIENPLSVASKYTIEPKGVIPKGSGTTSVPLSSLPADHLARNMSFEATQLTIPPKSFKTVGFTIKVPPTAKGSQYAGITISRLPDSDNLDLARSSEYERHVGLGMQPGLGIIIKVAMRGSTTYGYKMESVKVNRGTASRAPTATVTIRNTGNGELRINPILVLVDAAGKANIRMKSNATTVIVPGGTSDVAFESAGRDIPAGTYKAVLTVSDTKYQMAPTETTVSIK